MAHQDQLTVGGRHVATLTWTTGDFPWARGTFTPGPAAELLEGSFVTLADGRRDLDLDLLAAAGHPPETVLLDPETYLHALVVAADGSAAWRTGVEPAEVDPV